MDRVTESAFCSLPDNWRFHVYQYLLLRRPDPYVEEEASERLNIRFSRFIDRNTKIDDDITEFWELAANEPLPFYEWVFGPPFEILHLPRLSSIVAGEKHDYAIYSKVVTEMLDQNVRVISELPDNRTTFKWRVMALLNYNHVNVINILTRLTSSFSW